MRLRGGATASNGIQTAHTGALIRYARLLRGDVHQQLARRMGLVGEQPRIHQKSCSKAGSRLRISFCMGQQDAGLGDVLHHQADDFQAQRLRYAAGTGRAAGRARDSRSSAAGWRRMALVFQALHHDLYPWAISLEGFQRSRHGGIKVCLGLPVRAWWGTAAFKLLRANCWAKPPLALCGARGCTSSPVSSMRRRSSVSRLESTARLGAASPTGVATGCAHRPETAARPMQHRVA